MLIIPLKSEVFLYYTFNMEIISPTIRIIYFISEGSYLIKGKVHTGYFMGHCIRDISDEIKCSSPPVAEFIVDDYDTLENYIHEQWKKYSTKELVSTFQKDDKCYLVSDISELHELLKKAYVMQNILNSKSTEYYTQRATFASQLINIMSKYEN